MKTLLKIIAIVYATTNLAACKKSSGVTPSPAGAINVTNAVVGGATITLTSNYNIISSNNTVGNNAAAWFQLVGGNTQVNLGVPGIPATKASPAVPAIPYYSQILPVSDTTKYSLFLTGASLAQIDAVLIKESFKGPYADSVFGVRFINLSPGSSPVSVNIQGQAHGAEADGLAYKTYGGFVIHPAKAANSSYTFEFRDKATDSLIITYTLVTPYFNNMTLALRGMAGGSRGIIPDKDY